MARAEPGAEASGRPIAVVGTGLIGTSVALAARAAGLGPVRGWDFDGTALAGAVARDALEPADSLAACVRGAVIAVVSVPMHSIASTVAVCLSVDESVVVTDVGSAKARVAADVARVTEPDALPRFVPGHPMTGSERSGPEAASPVLLEGTVWVLCPGEVTDPDATAAVEALARALGGQPVRMDADRHDRLVALVSHVPQVASTALMRLAASRADEGDPELLLLAAGGFRDLTRLAASNPELWADILLANADRTREGVEAFRRALSEVASLLAVGDREALAALFREARTARLALAAKPQARVGVAILALDIPDRPGTLAEVTSTLGERGINIEDLEIIHSAEGAKGALHLTVGQADADAALEALAERGYSAGRLA